MSKKLLMALVASMVICGGCTQTDTQSSVAPERGDSSYLKGVNTRADQIYITSDEPAGANDYRNVYIAPANLANMQVIQPEGGAADKDWHITESEDKIIQKAIASEFAAALSYESAYNIVDSKEQAEIQIDTAVVAIHPNETSADVAAGAKAGGAITVSIAIIDVASGAVVVRSVDTKSSDDIWAFNRADNDDPAINLIFRSWATSIRRGMLLLQGRSTDPLSQPITLKEQI